MARLENWMLVSAYGGYDGDKYTAPELVGMELRGEVYDHPNPSNWDGKFVRTSPIVSFEGRTVTTQSGTVYELGKVAPGYLSYHKAMHAHNGMKCDLESDNPFVPVPVANLTEEKLENL